MVSSSVVVPRSGLYAEPRADWLAQYSEEIIDPGATRGLLCEFATLAAPRRRPGPSGHAMRP